MRIRALLTRCREDIYNWARRLMLHTSALGFTADLVHSFLGESMIFAAFYERIHERVISYSAFAATAIMYIDGQREREKHRAAMRVMLDKQAQDTTLDLADYRMMSEEEVG